MQEAVTLSLHLSITLNLLATGNGYKHLTFINVTSPQSNGDVCAWLMVSELISRNTVHKLFNILHNVLCHLGIF
jgi:hypothetical protein